MPDQRLPDPVDEAVRQWSERYPDGSGFRILTSLLRAYSVAVRGAEGVVRPLGLNLSRYEVLLLLSFTRTGSLPMTKVRDLLMVHGSSVTYLVNRLADAGLVERRGDPDDGRVSLVCITDAGRELVREASRRLVDAGFGTVGLMHEREREDLAALLARLRPAPEG